MPLRSDHKFSIPQAVHEIALKGEKRFSEAQEVLKKAQDENRPMTAEEATKSRSLLDEAKALHKQFADESAVYKDVHSS